VKHETGKFENFIYTVAAGANGNQPVLKLAVGLKRVGIVTFHL